MKIIKSIAVLLVFLMTINGSIIAQNKNQPITLGKKNYSMSDALDQNTVLWSKVVWEYIDLANPANKSLRTVIDANNKEEKTTLFNILKSKAYRNGSDVFLTADFNEKMKKGDLDLRLTNVVRTDDYTDVFEIKSDDIFGYLIKGIWYFDKIESKTRYKIIGITPMGPDIQTIGVQDIDDNNIYELMWAYYPAFENYFTNIMVSDNKNILRKVPLDFYLSNREFSGIEVAESSLNNNSSVFTDRKINSFQLKKSNTKTDSILKQKEMQFWMKKKEPQETKKGKKKRFLIFQNP